MDDLNEFLKTALKLLTVQNCIQKFIGIQNKNICHIFFLLVLVNSTNYNLITTYLINMYIYNIYFH